MNKVSLFIPEHLFLLKLCPLCIVLTLWRFKFNPDNTSFVEKN